jgi:hypothetical protein
LLFADEVSGWRRKNPRPVVNVELECSSQRNKIIKIADRHGWDVVKEYYIPHLADDNEDAVKLRAAINRAIRKRAKPYEHSNSTFTTGRGFFRRQPDTSSAKSNQPTFPAGACLEFHFPGHFVRQCPYKFRQYAPRKAPPLQILNHFLAHIFLNIQKDEITHTQLHLLLVY